MRSMGWRTGRLDVPDDLPRLIQTDSRKISAGQWFVPIIGENFDGHSFIDEVIQKGAAGFFFATQQAERISLDLRRFGIEVDNTTLALQALGRWWRSRHPSCRVVGITGSSGKTSVKELLFFMLEAVGPALKTEGSLNNELGVPLTLCQIQEQHQFAVIEMGARHKGDIAFLGQMVQQDVGVLLNVGTAHIGEFGSAEKILETKMEIAQANHCVYFRDDERIHKAMRALPGKILTTFGTHSAADVRILSTAVSPHGHLLLELSILGKTSRLDLPYFHESYATNVATVIAIGQSLGLSLDACLTGLQAFSGVKGRFKVHALPNMVLIDDAYNANPQSMRAGLQTVESAYRDYQKVLILGDMKELGDTAEEAHRAIGQYCAEQIHPLRLITVGSMGRWIADSALKSGMKPNQLASYDEVSQVLPHLQEICDKAQLLYVKASNSLRLSKIIDSFLSK